MLQDFFQNTFHIFKNIAVLETEHLVSCSFEGVVARFVFFAMKVMNAAIQFQY